MNPVPTVTVEVLSWLRGKLGYPDEGRVVLTEEIVDGETAGSLLTRLAAGLPGFGEQVYDAADERIREHVVVILDGRAIELAGGPAAPLHDGDRLVLLPGFAGGSEWARRDEATGRPWRPP